MKEIDKIRAHREALKNLWFSFDHSNKVEKRVITIEMDKYPARKGQGIVKIECDTKTGYSSSSSHCVNPIEYLEQRITESIICSHREDLSKYEIIIK